MYPDVLLQLQNKVSAEREVANSKRVVVLS